MREGQKIQQQPSRPIAKRSNKNQALVAYTYNPSPEKPNKMKTPQWTSNYSGSVIG
jgi:hypothetical protein